MPVPNITSPSPVSRSAALEGKVALIIGGTRGIGAAVSRRLAADGATIGIIYRNREAEASQLAEAFRLQGVPHQLEPADVGDQTALCQAMDRLIAHFGRIDVLVFVAGMAIVGPLESYADDDFDRLFALNVRAPFMAARKACGAMPGEGRIIIIGSIVADRMPGSGGTLYAASKAALGGMIRGLARDLGGRGITANLVQPGPIDTEHNPADGPNAAANRGPLAIDRHGRPEEVAALVAHLASAQAGFITGATYNIDGGWSA